MTIDEDSDLVPLPGFPFEVRASRGVEEKARTVAARCADAYRLLETILEFRPEVTLRVLARGHWPPDRPFGLPHYDAGHLVVAGEKAGFWRDFEPCLALTRPDLLVRAREVYGEDLDLAPFFDLLAVHELGHAFPDGRHSAFPRRWLAELFANLCLHTYVAMEAPAFLPVLVTFPDALVGVDPGRFAHRSLAEFEELYSGVGGVNYGWYQAQLHVAARRIYEQGGTEPLLRLWRRFVFSDPQLGDVLDEVDPDVARVLRDWPAKQA